MSWTLSASKDESSGGVASAERICLASIAARRKVLLVDGEGPTRTALSLLLRSIGYEVFTAADCPAAISLAEQSRPEIVILNSDAPPNSNAIHLMKWLRGLPNARSARFIFMGEDTPAGAGTHALGGAPAFIQKPFELSHLLAAIERA